MGTRPGTISARADDQGQGWKRDYLSCVSTMGSAITREGLFAVCFNDGEHHNQGVGLFAMCFNDREHHNQEVGLFAVCFNDGEHHNQKDPQRGEDRLRRRWGGVAKQKSDEVSPTDDEHTPKLIGDGGGKRSRRDVSIFLWVASP